ncbi:MAG: hypothetical protein M1830_004676, partial [Pleopsidium flavum]
SGILVDINKGDHPAGNEELGFQSMPAAWVRAMMLVSCNTIFLKGSKLAEGITLKKDRTRLGLVQDRYPLHLLLANRQITTELNSTSDNPRVDVGKGEVYSGGNFQAASVTSAMEKTRLSLQMLGRMLFGQFTELNNPSLSNGLPATPHRRRSEFVIHREGSGRQSGIVYVRACFSGQTGQFTRAVGGNAQPGDQLARLDISTLHNACSRDHIFDVYIVSLPRLSGAGPRVMHLNFLQALRPKLASARHRVASRRTLETYPRGLVLNHNFGRSRTVPAGRRDIYCRRCDSLIQNKAPYSASTQSIAGLGDWKIRMLYALNETYSSVCDKFFQHQDTAQSLGQASRKLYTFVRHQLGVPFHRGLVEHPSPKDDPGIFIDGRAKKTNWSWISIIYKSLRSGQLHEPVMMCLGKAEGKDGAGGIRNGFN